MAKDHFSVNLLHYTYCWNDIILRMLSKVIYVGHKMVYICNFDYQSNSLVFRMHDHFVLHMLHGSIHSNN